MQGSNGEARITTLPRVSLQVLGALSCDGGLKSRALIQGSPTLRRNVTRVVLSRCEVLAYVSVNIREWKSTFRVFRGLGGPVLTRAGNGTAVVQTIQT